MSKEDIARRAALSTANRHVISALSQANITGEVDGQFKGDTIIVTAVGDAPAVQIRDAVSDAVKEMTGVTVKINGRRVVTTFPYGD